MPSSAHKRHPEFTGWGTQHYLFAQLRSIEQESELLPCNQHVDEAYSRSGRHQHAAASTTTTQCPSARLRSNTCEIADVWTRSSSSDVIHCLHPHGSFGFTMIEMTEVITCLLTRKQEFVDWCWCATTSGLSTSEQLTQPASNGTNQPPIIVSASSILLQPPHGQSNLCRCSTEKV